MTNLGKEYTMSWASLYRVFRLAYNLIKIGGDINKFDVATYKHLFSQLDKEQKEHIISRFGDTLAFLKETN